jgi:hypothetical protein
MSRCAAIEHGKPPISSGSTSSALSAPSVVKSSFQHTPNEPAPSSIQPLFARMTSGKAQFRVVLTMKQQPT